MLPRWKAKFSENFSLCTVWKFMGMYTFGFNSATCYDLGTVPSPVTAREQTFPSYV